MSQLVVVTKPIRLTALYDQLVAAGIQVERFVTEDHAFQVPDSQNLAAMQAVIDAHDATATSPAEQQAAVDRTDIQGFLTAVDTAIVAVSASGWDGLTPTQRKTIALGILKALRVLARRLL